MSRSKNYTFQQIKKRNDINIIIPQKGTVIRSIFLIQKFQGKFNHDQSPE